MNQNPVSDLRYNCMKYHMFELRVMMMMMMMMMVMVMMMMKP